MRRRGGKGGGGGGGESVQRQTRTMKGKENGELFTPRAMHLTSFGSFKNVVSERYRFGFEEFDYLVYVAGTGRRDGETNGDYGLSLFCSRRSRISRTKQKLLIYFTSHHIKSKLGDTNYSFALKEKCHVNFKFI